MTIMKLNKSSTAFIFPGQGAQNIGMGKDLAQPFPIANELFQRSDEILGFSLSKTMWGESSEDLNDTINTQPALYAHSIASLLVFQDLYPDFRPKFVAGHSMGEISALTASGALPFEQGLRLVRNRGELMKQAGKASQGSMAAILGLDIPTVEQLCIDASLEGEAVQLANDNCPGQIVVSGSKSAVERLLPMAKEAGAKRAIPLAVSIAAHSELMRHAQADFSKAIENTRISTPNISTVGNVSAKPLTTISEIQSDLQAQLTSRVRWTESVEYMLEQGVDTFLELGSKDVLCGLIRRIDRETIRIPLGTPENFEKLNQ